LYSDEKKKERKKENVGAAVGGPRRVYIVTKKWGPGAPMWGGGKGEKTPATKVHSREKRSPSPLSAEGGSAIS